MNSCLRTQHRSFLNCQTARTSVLQRLPRALRQMPASDRRRSTNSAENPEVDGPPSPALATSSHTPDSSSHLRSAGWATPKGVTVAPPPRNILPELPACPPYPCGHLSDEEVAEYLFPLYEREWGIYSKLPSNGKPGSLMLAKEVKFAWHYPLVDFLTQLHVITKQENHHPRIVYEFRNVEIVTQTHSASAVKLEDGSVSKQHADRLAGITLRDVRLAYLIEEALWQYYDLGKVEQSTKIKFAQLSSLTIPGLPAPETTEAPRSGCIVCGGDHWATTCPQRFTTRPRILCELCGGEHWKFACPQYKLWRLSIKKGWNSPSPPEGGY